jgi:hypothetical protein
MKIKKINLKNKMLKKAAADSKIGNWPKEIESFLNKINNNKASIQEVIKAHAQFNKFSSELNDIENIISSYSASLPSSSSYFKRGSSFAFPEINVPDLMSKSNNFDEFFSKISSFEKPESLICMHFDEQIKNFKNTYSKVFTKESIDESFFDNLNQIIEGLKEVKDAIDLKRTANSKFKIFKTSASLNNMFNFPGLDEVYSREINAKINAVIEHDLFKKIMSGDYSDRDTGKLDDLKNKSNEAKTAVSAIPTPTPTISDEEQSKVDMTNFNAQEFSERLEVARTLGSNLNASIDQALSDITDKTNLTSLKDVLEIILQQATSALSTASKINFNLNKFSKNNKIYVQAGFMERIRSLFRSDTETEEQSPEFKQNKIQNLNKVLTTLKSNSSNVSISTIKQVIQEIDNYLQVESTGADDNATTAIAQKSLDATIQYVKPFFPGFENAGDILGTELHTKISTILGSGASYDEILNQIEQYLNLVTLRCENIYKAGAQIKIKMAQFIEQAKDSTNPGVVDFRNNLKLLQDAMNNRYNFSPEAVTLLKDKFSAPININNEKTIGEETYQALIKLNQTIDAYSRAL